MATMCRDDRMSSYELIDCTIFNAREKLGFDVDHIDFTTKLFGKWIQTRVVGSKPYDETLRLINAFAEKARKLDGEPVEEFDFTHYTLIVKDPKQPNVAVRTAWTCTVRAYVDKPTGRRCLEFREKDE